jgi:hypothetical protein
LVAAQDGGFVGGLFKTLLNPPQENVPLKSTRFSSEGPLSGVSVAFDKQPVYDYHEV